MIAPCICLRPGWSWYPRGTNGLRVLLSLGLGVYRSTLPLTPETLSLYSRFNFARFPKISQGYWYCTVILFMADLCLCLMMQNVEYTPDSPCRAFCMVVWALLKFLATICDWLSTQLERRILAFRQNPSSLRGEQRRPRHFLCSCWWYCMFDSSEEFLMQDFQLQRITCHVYFAWSW